MATLIFLREMSVRAGEINRVALLFFIGLSVIHFILSLLLLVYIEGYSTFKSSLRCLLGASSHWNRWEFASLLAFYSSSVWAGGHTQDHITGDRSEVLCDPRPLSSGSLRGNYFFHMPLQEGLWNGWRRQTLCLWVAAESGAGHVRMRKGEYRNRALLTL